MRVQARSTDGIHWQVRRGRDWLDLQGRIVERSASEKELLTTSRRLHREAWKGDGLRRTAYADWLVREGLWVEALEALDEILEDAPELDAAVALAQRVPVRLATADPKQDLVGWFRDAAKLGPGARELAIGDLAPHHDEEVAGLRAALPVELLHQNPKRRSLATLVLRRVLPGHEMRALLSRAVLDSSADVRTGAAQALRKAQEPAVIVPVVRALGSRSQSIRANAIDALGVMQFPAAVAPLYTHLLNLQSSGSGRVPHANIFIGRQLAYIQDFDVEVAQGAAIADPVVNTLTEGSVLDAAVLGVSQYVVAQESAQARRALQRLTGASPGRTTAAWKRWWQDHGDEWAEEATSPAAPVSPGSK